MAVAVLPRVPWAWLEVEDRAAKGALRQGERGGKNGTLGAVGSRSNGWD